MNITLEEKNTKSFKNCLVVKKKPSGFDPNYNHLPKFSFTLLNNRQPKAAHYFKCSAETKSEANSQQPNRSTTEQSKSDKVKPVYRLSSNQFISRYPLKFWSPILKFLWQKDQEAFYASVRKQTGKRRVANDAGSSYDEIIKFLKSDPNNTVSINLSAWQPSFICIDIDLSSVNKKLLNCFSDPKLYSLFQAELGNPLIVQTATPDHLHLYYMYDDTNEPMVNTKKLLPTRLGFKAEYIRGLVTVAGQRRLPMVLSRFNDISVLPKALYPYNYFKDDNLYHLIGETTKRDGTPEVITSDIGERNNKLFSFLKVDNFPKQHVYLVNRLCLESPLPENELDQTLLKSIPKYFRNKPSSEAYDHFKFVLNRSHNAKKSAPEFVDLYNERQRKAAFCNTPKDVYPFVDYVEKEFKVELPDEQWMGRSIDRVIMYFLIKQEFIKIYHISSEFSYVIWNGKYWQNSSENEVIEALYKAVLKIKYGGIEIRITQRSIIFPLKELCTVETWPHPFKLVGHNYKNGIAIYNEHNKITLIPHDPTYMHRRLIEANYVEQEGLNLECHALLSDITKGKLYFLHIFRLMVFLTLNPGYGNLAFILFGPAGAGKSIITNFLKSYLPIKSVGTIDEALLTRSLASKSTLVKDKCLIILPDITGKSLNEASVEFVKVCTGRDQLATDSKYKDAINFTSYGFIIASTNVLPSTMKAFRDEGFAQRFIQIPVPGVNMTDRLSNVGSILQKNKDQIANWAMNINKKFVKKNIRADGTNAVTNIDLNEIEIFLIDKLCFQPGSKLTTKQLSQSFESYKKECGELDSNKSYNYAVAIGKAMNPFSQRLIGRHRIPSWKNNKTRGFENVSFKPSSGKLESNQELFKFNVDPELFEQLNTNPWEDWGYLFYGEDDKFVQHPSNSVKAESHNTVLSMAVHEAGLSAAQASRQRPLSQVPFEHLYNNLIDDSHLTNLKDANWYKTKKVSQIKSPRDSATLLPEADLKTEFENNTKKVEMWSLLTSSNKTKQTFYPFHSFKLKRIATFKLKEEDLPYYKPKGFGSTTTTTTNTSTKQESPLKGDLEKESKTTTSEASSDQTSSKKTLKPKTAKTKPTSNQEKADKPPSRRGRPPKAKPPQASQAKQDGLDTYKPESYDFKKLNISDSKEMLLFIQENKRWFSTAQSLEDSVIFDKCLDIVGKSEGFNEDQIKGAISDSFDTSFNDFKNHAETLVSLSGNFDYVSRYEGFEAPYTGASVIEKTIKEFLLFPLKAPINLINFFNSLFGSIILKAWALTVSCKPRDSSEYYGKALSGTTPSTLRTNRQELDSILRQHNIELEETVDLISDGWSLFPLVYTEADDAYGRPLSKPSTGVSGLKAECKHSILKYLAKQTDQLNFVELDLKSCHTVIAFSFIAHRGMQVPKVNDLWPTLIEQFKDSFKGLDGTQVNLDLATIFETINSWDDTMLKSLLKTQWYKALNNGNVFNAMLHLDGNRLKLGIEKENLPNYTKAIDILFRQMPLFQSVSSFQGDLAERGEIYLPTSSQAFDTTTLSKAQSSQNSQTRVSMTGMSRLFSNCEIVVVVMLYMVLARSGYRLVPISYEADGLLLMGDFDKSQSRQVIKALDEALEEMVTKVFEDTFNLEFKSPT